MATVLGVVVASITVITGWVTKMAGIVVDALGIMKENTDLKVSVTATTPPDHAKKAEPATGVAVRVTGVPAATETD